MTKTHLAFREDKHHTPLPILERLGLVCIEGMVVMNSLRSASRISPIGGGAAGDDIDGLDQVWQIKRDYKRITFSQHEQNCQ